MFCKFCGSSLEDGSKFCTICGKSLIESAPAAVPPREEKQKKQGGFFSSPGGIILVLIIGLAVIAGITLGTIFLVKMGSNDSVDAETVEVWDEYEELLSDDSDEIAQINMDPNALTKTQEELKKTQERVAALEKVLQQTGGTATRRNTARRTTRRVANNTNNARDRKADEMAAALAAYNDYIKKMDEFYGALIGAITTNQLIVQAVIDNLNTMLAELQELAADVKDLTNKFLKDNDKVTVAKFNPPILLFAKDIAAETEKSVTAAQQAEATRLEAERVAAEQAAAAAAEAERQRQAAAAAAEAAQQQQEEDTGWT